MEDVLQGLNAAQYEAVTTTEGMVRVIAGAGSGKTRALSRRFAYLVNEIGILPGNILCVTFTNKSANEMRQRIHLLTGDNDTGYINTFHGFCVSVLQEDSYAVQYPKSFLVLDHADIDAMLKIIYEERGLTLRNMTFSKARDMIEIRKLKKDPLYYLDLIQMSLEELQEKYKTAVETQDIIFYVDEFQDIDKLQYRLMEVLCGYHKNLFIVGDPDQTIYTWRGADVKFLLDFDKHFPGVKTIMMMENYRSTPEILSVANSLIAKNQNRMQKDLLPTLPGGKPVLCHHGKTAEEEAIWMAKKIEELHQDGVPYREITILYRAHYLTRTVEEVFLKEKIPYTIYSGIQFFGRMEIKDALSYLRMLAYKDDLSFARIANVPKRNLGERRMAFLREYAEQNQCSLYDALRKNLEHEMMKGTKAASFVSLIENLASNVAERPVSEVLSEILDMSGYEKMLRTEGSQERLDNLAELKQSIYEYETTCGEEATLEYYLTHVALFTNSDLESGKDQVRMMTVHSAKGLEFPYVFLCGMNEGIFPSRKTNTKQAMEEERRLAFVAVTRAEKGLFLTEAEGRNFDGSMRYPSRFLLDIDEKYLTHTEPLAKDRYAEARCYIAGKERYLEEQEKGASFISGDRIQHPIFGKGSILEVDTERGAYLIRFDEMETFRSISIRAKLEKIDF